MNDAKYIGLDVHPVPISAAVLDSAGKLILGCVLKWKPGIEAKPSLGLIRNRRFLRGPGFRLGLSKVSADDANNP